MNVPKDLRYTEKHEWVRIEGDKAYVGITDFAQDQLGEVVAVSLPSIGQNVKKGGQLAELDSMKTSEVAYSPISGEVIAVNEALETRPELINEDPYGEGYIAVLEPDDLGELESLMTAEEYEEFLAKEA